jgi:hypothetical protein
MEGKIEAYKAITKKIDDLKDQIRVIAKDIVKDHCPYKKGDKVIYTEWWRGNGKDYYGVVTHVEYSPDRSAAIDGLWKIAVSPTTKAFVSKQGQHTINLGHYYKGDKIRKA